ncbi:MAG: helix-turn-helix domain-containing protein [Polyangia bacterium]
MAASVHGLRAVGRTWNEHSSSSVAPSGRCRVRHRGQSTGSLAISEVARDSGFGDVHTFIRCFRAKFGRTPGAFRRDGRLDGVA